ncbi:MAG TPA: acyltransferase domain-containing protein [Steroidobacteraceae bacterium]|nr:acyltransferase domain-containing protein [Steroidobacteraceae bacterium]
MSVAFLFPGQGAQVSGFLHALPDHQAVHETLAEAEQLTQCDVLQLDTEAALASTISLQLATLIAGVATTRALRAEGVTPDLVAGLSVGTFAAAVASGALQFAAALSLVSLRARLMKEAYPQGYGLAAIVGLSERRVREEIIEAGQGSIFVASINAPAEIVLAGSDAAIAAAITAARAAGARHAERLAVAVPSHCRLLDSVAAALGAALREVAVANPAIPYVGSRSARVLRDAGAVREELAGNVAHTMRWHDAATLLHELGATLFLEMPPGKVLTVLACNAFPRARARAMAHLSLRLASQLADQERGS